MTIYGLFDPRTEACRYVGKTVLALAKRLSLHMSDARQNRQRRCARWIRGLLSYGLRPAVASLEVTDDGARELWWMDRMEERYGALLNHVRVACTGPVAYKRPAATRAKLARAARRTIAGYWRGRHFTAEHRARIGAALRGNRNAAGTRATAATRARLSHALKGRKVTPETRAKIAATLQGRKQPRDVVDKRAAKARGRKHPPRTLAARRRMREAALKRWAQVTRLPNENIGGILP